MTGIVFENFVAGEGDATLPRMRGYGRQVTPAADGSGNLPRFIGASVGIVSNPAALPRIRGYGAAVASVYGVGRLQRMQGFGSGSAPTPTVAIQIAALPTIAGYGYSYSVEAPATQTADLPRIRSFALDTSDGVALAQLPRLRGYAAAVAAPSSFVFALQSPGYASIIGTGAVGAYAELSDHIAVGDSQSADAIQALLDLIHMSDAYSYAFDVIQSLLDRFSARDVAQMIWEADLVDQFIASGVLAGTAQLTVLLTDTFTASGTPTSISDILAAIRDGFYVSLTLNNGDEGYTAWVMTPQTKAVRGYTNYPFNSYATLGDQFFGAGEAGIYRMGGTTDAGEVIRASIRTGLMNFGSESMKADNKAYVGTTTSGALLMRVQATTFDGRRVEQTYRMIPAVVDDARAMRVDIGRGFRSVYWIFEIANDEDGAAFEVHNWHLLPVTLTGRLI